MFANPRRVFPPARFAECAGHPPLPIPLCVSRHLRLSAPSPSLQPLSVQGKFVERSGSRFLRSRVAAPVRRVTTARRRRAGPLGHDGESHRRTRWQRGPGHHSQRDDRPQACARDALGSRACTFAPGEQPRPPRVPTMPGPADAPRSPACQTQATGFPGSIRSRTFPDRYGGRGHPCARTATGGVRHKPYQTDRALFLKRKKAL